MTNLSISQQDYDKLRSSGQTKEQIFAKYSQQPKSIKTLFTDFGGNVMRGANAITDFVGARGIADEYGASFAQSKLALQGQNEASKLVQHPDLRTVVGSAIQTGANFIPGAGVGAKLATKALIGAGTGYAFDVGQNLQMGKKGIDSLTPKIGTATGIVTPILGKILGFAGKNIPEALARKLEDVSLRLTPVERQNLAKKGTDIVSYNSKNKISGNPQQRYAKVLNLYNGMERKVQAEVDKAKVTIPTKNLIQELKKIPDAFVDDPELADEAVRTVGRLIESLSTQRGENLTTNAINQLKRNYMNRSFAKNTADVLSESRLAIASVLNGTLRKAVPRLEKLNEEYGLIIASRRALHKALSRNEIGLVGKIAGIAAGSALGNLVAPGVGTAAGAIVGPTIGKAIAGTQVRTRLGAGAQRLSQLTDSIKKLPIDGLGNISQKALLNLLENLRQ